jgi:putative transposase
LGRWKEHYATTGRSISLKRLSAELTALKAKPETAWLSECDSQALQQVLADLHRSYANFFRKRARLPRFKSRKRYKARFRIPQRVKVADGKVYVPKVGWVRIRQSREVDGPTKGATFRREADGHWYVSLTVEFEMPDVAIPAPEPERTIGIDLGLIDFVTPSDGSKPVPAPKFYRKATNKIRRAQKAVSRRQKGSKRREKARNRLARAHQEAGRQRQDFLHKLSTDLVGRYEAICIEDLNVKGLARTKLAKSFADAAMSEFRRQLEYKCSWNRRTLVVIDRFFPSSKMCNRCGALNDRLALSDREWDCDCGARHKRDFLAACNIRDEGLRLLAAGQAERLNAQGASVSLDRPGCWRRTENPASFSRGSVKMSYRPRWCDRWAGRSPRGRADLGPGPAGGSINSPRAASPPRAAPGSRQWARPARRRRRCAGSRPSACTQGRCRACAGSAAGAARPRSRG